MTPALVTLNVSVEQIERDLKAGRSVEEIAQDWSEPRANVYAVKRAMDASSGAPTPAPTPPLHVARPAPVPADADAGLTAMVLEASRSKSARTRALGAKLDKLVEDLQARLSAERADAAEQEAKRAERQAAADEVKRLEAALREARAKLGRNAVPASPSRSKEGAAGGATARPAYDGGPPPSVIRAWARDNAVDCPRVGTLPGRVINAYRSAAGDAG